MAPEAGSSKGKAQAEKKPEPPVTQTRMEVDTDDEDDDNENDNDERIKKLEGKLEGAERYAEQQQDVINQQAGETDKLRAELRQLMARLATVERRPAVERTVFEPSTAGVASQIKIPAPDKYDGNRAKLRTYLTQMKDYLENFPEVNTGQKKVRVAARFLTGAAHDWFEPTLRDFLENEYGSQSSFTRTIFATYDNYENAIKGAFGEPDEERVAQNKLHHLRQQRSASEYAVRFRQLSSTLGYPDKALIDMFYRGLKEEVKDEVIKVRPAPLDLTEYIEMAVSIDNMLYERRMEKKGNYGSNFRKKYQPNISKKRQNGNTSWGYHSGPMEIDATHKQGQGPKKGVCFNCGEEGHWARKCTKPRQHKGHRGPPRNRNGPPQARLPEPREFSATEPAHGSTSWTACYNDDCQDHKGSKEDSGWYPKRPTTKVIAATMAYNSDNDPLQDYNDNEDAWYTRDSEEEESSSEEFQQQMLGHDNPRWYEDTLKWAREANRINPGIDKAEACHDRYYWKCFELDHDQDPGSEEDAQRLAYAIHSKNNPEYWRIGNKKEREAEFRKEYYRCTTGELQEWRTRKRQEQEREEYESRNGITWLSRYERPTVTLDDVIAHKEEKSQTLEDGSDGVCSKYGELIDKMEQVQHEQDMQNITLDNIRDDVKLIKEKWVMKGEKKPLQEIMDEGKDVPEPLQRIEGRLGSIEKAILTMAESSSRALHELHNEQRQNQNLTREIHEQARIIKNVKDEAKKLAEQTDEAIQNSLQRQKKYEEKTAKQQKKGKKTLAATVTRNNGHLTTTIQLNGHKVTAMVDSGAMGIYISPGTVNKLGLPYQKKEHPYSLATVDGKPINYEGGRVRFETAQLEMTIGGRTENVRFDVTNTGRHQVVLGLPWLQTSNPIIDWATDQLWWNNTQSC